jgi:hypothetical protein
MTDDPGASIERTRLSWRRTTLSATAVGLLTARPAFDPRAGVLAWLVAALGMTAWVALVGLGYRRASGLRARPPRAARRAMRAYALIIIVFAALGGLVVML